MLRVPAAIFLLSSSCMATAASGSPPTRYVDHGACPFECCTYRQWSVEKDTIIRAAPTRHSEKVAILKKGMTVDALTGDVDVVPSRLHVKKTHDTDKPGDVLWVYTYLGEGFFKVWRNGEMVEEELEFSAYPGGIPDNRCSDRPSCWGELDEPLQMTWWIKLRTHDGVEGWTNQSRHFGGADACG